MGKYSSRCKVTPFYTGGNNENNSFFPCMCTNLANVSSVFFYLFTYLFMYAMFHFFYIFYLFHLGINLL